MKKFLIPSLLVCTVLALALRLIRETRFGKTSLQQHFL